MLSCSTNSLKHSLLIATIVCKSLPIAVKIISPRSMEIKLCNETTVSYNTYKFRQIRLICLFQTEIRTILPKGDNISLFFI